MSKSDKAAKEVSGHQNAIQALRSGLNKRFVERKDVIDGILVGLLAKENVFLLGPPGGGKSALTRAVCKAFTGAKYFEWMIGKTTSPDELFGAVSIESMKQSRYERMTTNKLPDADIAFLDEIFKGSSAILNTLLPIMNERIFHNGPSPTDLRLQIVVGASNEIPSSEELGAMYDRFALRFEVEPIKNDDSMLELLLGSYDKDAIPNVTLEQLAVEQEAAANVKITRELGLIVIELKKLVNQAGFFVSDRKWRQAMDIVKANAHLNGRTEATNEDLEILEFVLWHEPGQRKEIKRMIAKCANPVGEVIVKVMDGVEEVMQNLKDGRIQPIDALNKIKTAQKQLEKANDGKMNNQKLVDAIDRCKSIKVTIAKDYLGMD